MLHAHNIALLIDSNVLMDILHPDDMGDMRGALAGWIRATLKNADQLPHGKTITLLVTTGIFHDYRSGFGRRKYRIDPSAWTQFRKSALRRMPVGNNTYFMIQKIRPADGSERMWPGDRYDVAYFKALESAAALERLGDRHIVFASADRSTRDRVDRAPLPMGSRKRLHVVGDKDALDDLIMN